MIFGDFCIFVCFSVTGGFSACPVVEIEGLFGTKNPPCGGFRLIINFYTVFRQQLAPFTVGLAVGYNGIKRSRGADTRKGNAVELCVVDNEHAFSRIVHHAFS